MTTATPVKFYRGVFWILPSYTRPKVLRNVWVAPMGYMDILHTYSSVRSYCCTMRMYFSYMSVANSTTVRSRQEEAFSFCVGRHKFGENTKMMHARNQFSTRVFIAESSVKSIQLDLISSFNRDWSSLWSSNIWLGSSVYARLSNVAYYKRASVPRQQILQFHWRLYKFKFQVFVRLDRSTSLRRRTA